MGWLVRWGHDAKNLERAGTPFRPFLTRFDRAHGAQVDVKGLWLDGDRTSIAPMAGRIAGADGHALRPCVGQNPWAVAAVPRRLARTVVARLHKSDVWILDETAFPTAGAHSVGVARQSCGTRGPGGALPGRRALAWESC
jgi:SRSO17 transposase